MPANGDEGGDAAYLIRQKEAAQGNDVAAISMDGAGYRGPVLRELTEPDGLNLQVYTPPSARIPLTGFGPEQFPRSADGNTLTCPAGQTTGSYERSANDPGLKVPFAKERCRDAAVRAPVVADRHTKNPTLLRSDYAAEHPR